VLKKKYNLQKQLHLKHNYKKLFVTSLINKSLGKNHYIAPLERISQLCQPNFVETLLYKFSTFQKLQCLITLSGKVHSRSYSYSRFFLNKQFDKITISNTLK